MTPMLEFFPSYEITQLNRHFYNFILFNKIY